MNQLLTITPQWQIYLPFEIRKTLKLTQPKKAKARTLGNQLIITFPKSPLLELAGKYRYLLTKNRINLTKIRDLIDYSNL